MGSTADSASRFSKLSVFGLLVTVAAWVFLRVQYANLTAPLRAMGMKELPSLPQVAFESGFLPISVALLLALFGAGLVMRGKRGRFLTAFGFVALYVWGVFYTLALLPLVANE